MFSEQLRGSKHLTICINAGGNKIVMAFQESKNWPQDPQLFFYSLNICVSLLLIVLLAFQMCLRLRYLTFLIQTRGDTCIVNI